MQVTQEQLERASILLNINNSNGVKKYVEKLLAPMVAMTGIAMDWQVYILNLLDNHQNENFKMKMNSVLTELVEKEKEKEKEVEEKEKEKLYKNQMKQVLTQLVTIVGGKAALRSPLPLQNLRVDNIQELPEPVKQIKVDTEVEIEKLFHIKPSEIPATPVSIKPVKTIIKGTEVIENMDSETGRLETIVFKRDKIKFEVQDVIECISTVAEKVALPAVITMTISMKRPDDSIYYDTVFSVEKINNLTTLEDLVTKWTAGRLALPEKYTDSKKKFIFWDMKTITFNIYPTDFTSEFYGRANADHVQTFLEEVPRTFQTKDIKNEKISITWTDGDCLLAAIAYQFRRHPLFIKVNIIEEMKGVIGEELYKEGEGVLLNKKMEAITKLEKHYKIMIHVFNHFAEVIRFGDYTQQLPRNREKQNGYIALINNHIMIFKSTQMIQAKLQKEKTFWFGFKNYFNRNEKNISIERINDLFKQFWFQMANNYLCLCEFNRDKLYQFLADKMKLNLKIFHTYDYNELEYTAAETVVADGDFRNNLNNSFFCETASKFEHFTDVEKYEQAKILHQEVPVKYRQIEKFIKDEQYDKRKLIVADLETATIKNTPFQTYAIGIKYYNEKGEPTYLEKIAEKEIEFKDLAVKAFIELEKKLPVLDNKEENERKEFSVYFHNGSRFDGRFLIEQITQFDKQAITQQLECDGKIISFKWRSYTFLDSCLLFVMSLRSCCFAYGIEVKKGDFPHLIFQNIDAGDYSKILNSNPQLETLRSKFDLLSDVSNEKTQSFTLESGKMNDEYAKSYDTSNKNNFKTFQWFEEHKHENYNVKENLKSYLYDDVDSLFELMNKFAQYIWDKFQINILQNTPTLGSVATKIWQSFIPEDRPIYKITPDIIHSDNPLDARTINLRWRSVNQGGFSSPLNQIIYEQPKGGEELLVKHDITSQYPSCTSSNKFIDPWYQDFPMPTPDEPFRYGNYDGFELTDNDQSKTILAELRKQAGEYDVEFDQSGLREFVILSNLKHIRGKVTMFSTLTPVMKGRQHLTVAMILYAYDMGVKLKLYTGTYTYAKGNPFINYMNYFKVKKSLADLMIAKNLDLTEEQLHRRLDGSQKDVQEAIIEYQTCTLSYEERKQKYDFERTICKLFLNSLLGRLNMRIFNRSNVVTTTSLNDVASMIGNPNIKVKNVFEIHKDNSGGGNLRRRRRKVWRVKYAEHQNQSCYTQFKVAPYLTGYMLSYSKILVNRSFQWMAENGVKALYTDTDSIISVFPNRDTLDRYELEFRCRDERGFYKRFSYMDEEKIITEGGYHCAPAPKKYLTGQFKEDGSFSGQFKANGIQAKQQIVNFTQRNMKKVFEDAVLRKQSISLKSFTMAKSKENVYELSPLNKEHGKTLKFLCMKARYIAEGGKLVYWQSKEEFDEYCRDLIGTRGLVLQEGSS